MTDRYSNSVRIGMNLLLMTKYLERRKKGKRGERNNWMTLPSGQAIENTYVYQYKSRRNIYKPRQHSLR